MECNVCHHQNAADAHFCVNCGNPLQLTCPVCSHEVTAEQNFCGNCGHDLRGRPDRASPASYTPEHLAKRILDERDLVVGERKRVTVLFADVVGSTAAIERSDPEDAARFLTDALGAMMDAVHGAMEKALGRPVALGGEA